MDGAELFMLIMAAIPVVILLTIYIVNKLKKQPKAR